MNGRLSHLSNLLLTANSSSLCAKS